MNQACLVIPKIALMANAEKARPSPRKRAIAKEELSDEEDAVEAPKSSQKKKKKKKRGLQPDTAARSDSDCGIFYCKDVGTSFVNLLPKKMSSKPCAGFCFIGKECNSRDREERC